MKKNMVRILAFVLVLILALGIIPLGALAADVTVAIWGQSYDKHPTYAEFNSGDGYTGDVLFDHESKPASVTIKTSDYSSHVYGQDGMKYDIAGFVDEKNAKPGEKVPLVSSLTFKSDNIAYLLYTPHQHKLSYWYSDNTTHWRECLTCKHAFGEHWQFMFQNWHSDGDEDRVCDVCGHDIPYHEIDVEEVKGGKITVELDEAPYRKKIVATAEPEEGYKLKKIHFIKVRDNGTEQEITRRKTSTKGTWWTYMPTYDLKVTAEFVKKK